MADQGQRAGPELLDQRPRPRRDPDRQRVEGGGRRHEHRRRHVAAAALGVEELLDRVLVEGVGGQAVDGVRRQHHEAAALDGQAGRLDGGLALLVGGGRVALHRPHRASRAVVNRGRPARSRWSRTSVQRPVAVEDGRHGVALDLGVLDPEHSPGPEQHRGADRQHPDRVEAVGAREQREVRVVVARFRSDRLPRLQRDVRRVADHHVDGAGQVVEGGEGVAQPQVHAGAGQVARGPAVGRLVELDGMHLGVRHLVGDRLGDRAGAGAEVDHDRRLEGAGGLDGPAGQQLGLRPGREDTGTDLEPDVAEPRLAGQVLERLAGRPPGHEGVVPLEGLGRHVVDQRQPGPVGAEHVGEQLGGVVLGAGDAGVAQASPRPRRGPRAGS